MLIPPEELNAYDLYESLQWVIRRVTIKAGIVGATGYTGAELLRLLAFHPEVEIAVITSRAEAGRRVDEVFANLRGVIDLLFSPFDMSALSACDVVLFATPNGTAMNHVPELLAAGTKIIDLAADFRLKDPSAWEQWYGMSHACPELLAEAVYGLPELNRQAIREARLVANPGCYPTAVMLGLLPLVEQRKIDLQHVIADAKSGVSGAGRKAQLGTLFSEAADNFKAYAVAGHRHLPEIQQGLSQAAGGEVRLTFVPHLVPMIRGLHATVYATPTDQAADLQALFETRYADEPFVDVLPPGAHPETRTVRSANHCRMAVHRSPSGHSVVVLSVIDNLVKGAGGQAIQNMNIMFACEEVAGLQGAGVLP